MKNHLTYEESPVIFFLARLLAELSEGTFYHNHDYFCGFADKIIDDVFHLNGGKKASDPTLAELQNKIRQELLNAGYFPIYARRNGLRQWTKEDAEKARAERIRTNQC